VYWRRATNQGALVSIFLGLAIWLSVLAFGGEDPFLPAQFAGLIASGLGMVVGSLMPQFVHHDPGIHDALRHGHHAAAATYHVSPHAHSGQPAGQGEGGA
jgi:Na+/proline symporter